MNLNNLKKLIMVANSLDQKGLFKEADALDDIIKLSMPVRGYTDPIGEEPSDASVNLGKGMLGELTLLGRNIIWVPVNTDNLLANPVEREKFFDLFGQSKEYKKFLKNTDSKTIFDIENFKNSSGRLSRLIENKSVPIEEFFKKYKNLETQIKEILNQHNLKKEDVVIYISNIAPLRITQNLNINEHSEFVPSDETKNLEFVRNDPAWETHDFWHGSDTSSDYSSSFFNTINKILESYHIDMANQNTTKFFIEATRVIGPSAFFALLRDFLKDKPGLFRDGSVTIDSAQDIYRYLALYGPEELKSAFVVPETIRIPGSFAKLKNPELKEGLKKAWDESVDKAFKWIQKTKDESGKPVGPYSEYEGEAVVAPFL